MFTLSFAISSQFLFRLEKNGGYIYDKLNDNTIVINDIGAKILLAISENPNVVYNQIPDLMELIQNHVVTKKEAWHFISKMKRIGILIESQCSDLPNKFNVSRENQRIPISQTSDSSAPVSAPMYLEIYPTMSCNLHCLFCFIDDSVRKEFSYSRMSFPLFRKVVEEALEHKIFYISLLGGEPLLIPWLGEAIEFCEAKRMRLEIVTNATLIDETIAKRLKGKRLVSLNVSLHGKAKTHDLLTSSNKSYERVLKGLDLLKKYNVKFSIGFTFTRINNSIDDIANVIQIAQEHAVENLSVRCFQAVGHGADHVTELSVSPQEVIKSYERIVDLVKERMKIYALGTFAFIKYHSPIPRHPLNKIRAFFCDVGIRKLDILPNGDVIPCILLWQTDRERFILGNVEKDCLLELWEKSSILSLLRNNKGPTECKECKYIEICRGGCPVTARIKYRSWNRRDPNCPNIIKVDEKFGK